MNNLLNRIITVIMPIIGMLIFLALLIIAVIFLSYFFITIAIIGFVLFLVGYIRTQIMLRRHKHQNKNQDDHKGRVIEHDDSK